MKLQEERRAKSEAEERARRAHEEALQVEAKLTEERKCKVAEFLQEHGFKDVASAKKAFLSTTYPLHCAAEKGQEDMVKMLMEEGADPAQKNSSGKTAAQVAQKKGRSGSHDKVLQALGGA